MAPMSLLLVLALQLLMCNRASSSPSIPITGDGEALRSLIGPLSSQQTNIFASWNDSLSYCRWPGVFCGGHKHPNRVIGLKLDSSGLTGSIPPSISNLTFLRYLTLADNRLHSDIPVGLCCLPRLRYINLS